MKVNLESIRKYFPKLKRFLARIEIDDVILIADKYNLSVDTDKVLECLQNLFVITAFGSIHNRFDIEIPTECVIECLEWLKLQDIDDSLILLDRLNMIDREDDLDEALFELYGCLTDNLEEV